MGVVAQIEDELREYTKIDWSDTMIMVRKIDRITTNGKFQGQGKTLIDVEYCNKTRLNSLNLTKHTALHQPQLIRTQGVPYGLLFIYNS